MESNKLWRVTIVRSTELRYEVYFAIIRGESEGEVRELVSLHLKKGCKVRTISELSDKEVNGPIMIAGGMKCGI